MPSSSTTGNGQGRYPERRDGAARSGRSRLHSHGSGHRLVGIGLVLPSARFQQFIDSRSPIWFEHVQTFLDNRKKKHHLRQGSWLFCMSARFHDENTTHLSHRITGSWQYGLLQSCVEPSARPPILFVALSRTCLDQYKTLRII